MTKIYICAATDQLIAVRAYLDHTSITSLLRTDGYRGILVAVLNPDAYQDRLASIYLADINRILAEGEDKAYYVTHE